MKQAESPATLERLSAYLDGELTREEARSLERHLASHPESRAALDGLRATIRDLRQWPTVEPPPTLEHHVARRVALERGRTSWSDRLEARLRLMSPHNPILLMFALVVSLAMAMYLLSLSAHRAERDDVAVVLVDDVLDGEGDGDSRHVRGTRREIAGRAFFWTGGHWQQRGIGDPGRTIELSTAAGEAWFEAHPDLLELRALREAVVVEAGGEVVMLVPAPNGDHGALP